MRGPILASSGAASTAGSRPQVSGEKPSRDSERRGEHLGRVRRALRLLALDPHHAIRHLATGFALGGVVVAMTVGIYALAGWYHVEAVRFEAGPLLLGGLGSFFLVAFYEEFLIRGIVFRGIEFMLGSVVALVLSSLLFGALHFGNPGATAVGALEAAAGGVVFGCLYMLTRSLWLAIGAHWAADFWQGSFFGLHVAGTTVKHPLIHSTLAGPKLWIGDQFGGALVALAIFLPIMVALLVLTWQRGCFRKRHPLHLTPRLIPHSR